MSAALAVLSSMTFDAVVLVDDERRYLRTNDAGTRLLGSSRENLLRNSIDDYTSAQFQPLLPDLWAALERDGHLSGAYEARRGDGTVGMIEFAARRDLFEGQHLIVARELPRQPTPRLGFALLDPHSGEIAEASPECCRLIGRTRASLLSAGVGVFGGARQRDETVRAMRAIAAGEQASYEFRCEASRPGDGTQWLAVNLRPVLGAVGRPVRILLEAVPFVVGAAAAAPLTAREREVLQLAADGGTAEEIAEMLVLSAGTVRTHFRNVYAKLGVGDRAAAVAEAMRRGLIE